MGETCEVCGREKGISFNATDAYKKCLGGAPCLERAYEREKARANDEYERAEMFQRDARRSDAALVVANARAEKAEAEEAIAWSEVHDHEAVIRNFEKSVDKLQEALVAARRECDLLGAAIDRAVSAFMSGGVCDFCRNNKEKGYHEEDCDLGALIAEAAVAANVARFNTALAAPAAGEEGKT